MILAGSILQNIGVLACTGLPAHADFPSGVALRQTYGLGVQGPALPLGGTKFREGDRRGAGVCAAVIMVRPCMAMMQLLVCCTPGQDRA